MVRYTFFPLRVILLAPFAVASRLYFAAKNALQRCKISTLTPLTLQAFCRYEGKTCSVGSLNPQPRPPKRAAKIFFPVTASFGRSAGNKSIGRGVPIQSCALTKNLIFTGTTIADVFAYPTTTEED